MMRLATIMWFAGAVSGFAQQPCPTPPSSYYYAPGIPSYSYSYSAPVCPPGYSYSVPTSPPPPVYTNNSQMRANMRFTNIPRSARVFVDGYELDERFRLANGTLALWTQDLNQNAYAVVRVYINVDGFYFDASRRVAYGPGSRIEVDSSDFGLQRPGTVVTPPPPDYSARPVITVTRSFSSSSPATNTPSIESSTYYSQPSTTTSPYRQSTTTYSHQSGTVTPSGQNIPGPSISIIRSTQTP